MGFWNSKKGDDSDAAVPRKELTTTSAPASAAVAHRPEVPVAPPDRPASDAESVMRVRSALGPGTVIQGKLSFDAPVSIDGKLGGEVFSSKALLVGKTGIVDAKVDVASLIVFGRVRGTVSAAERVEIRAGAVVEAEIVTPILVVEEGGVFNGSCQRGGAVRPISAGEPVAARVVAGPDAQTKRKALVG